MSVQQRHERLRVRAEMLARLRAFFAERGFLEVETPLLDREIIPELHIEPFGICSEHEATPGQRPGLQVQPRALPGGRMAPTLWLQASPELHMKGLLAEGLPAIYQVTRSFRRGERGRIHNPEFTMVEWYRAGDGMEAGMELLESLCCEVAGAATAKRTTYGQAFLRHAGVNPHTVGCDELADAARRLGVAAPETIGRDDRDEWLNLLLATIVEPKLGAVGPEILYDYPASQSALAKTVQRSDGVEVAERFELYWCGVELANGYHELTDAAVLRDRLELVNRARVADGRPALPLPEQLLAAMEDPGLPACSGCALGFDRFIMLACGASSIEEVMAFAWE
jgi:lysyl-tRNA synthetase class 2